MPFCIAIICGPYNSRSAIREPKPKPEENMLELVWIAQERLGVKVIGDWTAERRINAALFASVSRQHLMRLLRIGLVDDIGRLLEQLATRKLEHWYREFRQAKLA